MWWVAPKHHMKRHGKDRESLLQGSGRTTERGRINTQLFISHFGGIDSSYRFKLTKNWGQGTKCVHRQFSHRCGLLGHYLSSCSGRELLSGDSQVVHPKEGLRLGVISVPYHEDVINHFCSSLIPRWLQSDCRENGSEQKQIQNTEIPCFFLLLVNSWSQCFSAKAV
jgi:hypothetical protein